MSDNDQKLPEQEVDSSTRRIDTSELSPVVVKNSHAVVDYPLPWVIELRVVGTASVMQVQVRDQLTIGRTDPKGESNPEINLDPYDAYRSGVSRRHAMIFPYKNRLRIRDLGSANGTFVNGVQLAPNTDYRINHGDMIMIGKLQMQLMFAVMPASKDIEKTQPINFKITRIGHGEELLIVDDDRDVSFVIGSVLEKAGFTVKRVFSYNDAIVHMQQKMPGAVLLELMLPDGGGMDLVRFVRNHAEGKNTPLMVVTTASAGYKIDQAIDAGVDVFVTKPVGIDELLRGVEKLMGQPQS